MRVSTAFLLLTSLVPLGCGGTSEAPPNKTSPQVAQATSPNRKPTTRSSSPATHSTSPTKPSSPLDPIPSQSPPDGPIDPDEPELKPEVLPEFPKSDPKSVVKELNKEKTLFIETRPDQTKRIVFVAEVCMRRGILEVFLCKKMTKEHEAILRSDLDARYLHAALVAIGAEKGNPVQFINPKTEEPEYKPASGQTIRVEVAYTKDGKVHQHVAQDWITDKKTTKPMAHEWVFAGSRFMKNPDRPEDEPPYYCANNGEVISLSNFSDSMLDLPVKVSQDAQELNFEAETKRIPPVRTKVWVILEPVAKMKEKK